MPRSIRLHVTTASALLAFSLLAACSSSDPPYDKSASAEGQKSGGSSGSGTGESGGIGGSASGSNGSGGSGGASANGGNGGSSGGGGAAMGGTATSYNVDVSQTSTSGISAGGFMAVQFHVAFSSIMKGAAVFAGGPFACAQGELSTAYTQCMYPVSAPSVAPMVSLTAQYAAAGAIDDPKGLSGQKVFLFGGADDHTVAPAVMDALQNYYATYVSSSDIKYENRHAGAAHTMPTVSYGGTCDVTAQPWIGNCNYDGAGTALAQIYGTLAPKASSLSGEYVTLAQADFLPNPSSHSVADTGYAYVPASCKNGDQCRVHVAFHGCQQYASGMVGDAYYKNAGYNEWADTNHIIVLYPQTIASMGTETNPEGCWDWWGYDSPDYSKKTGPQMTMVRKMIDFLAGK